MRFTLFTLIPISAFVLAGCAHGTPSSAPDTAPTIAHEVPAPPPRPSTSEINGHEGSNVHGAAIFTNEGSKIHVVVEVTGLKPNSVHGVHIHEKGSCDGAKFEGAGGHFNPWTTKHGGADSKMRHAGDLGNLKADADGHAKIDLRIPSGPETETFGGKSIILHAKNDDLHSQPAGDSGDRIACGLIKQQD